MGVIRPVYKYPSFPPHPQAHSKLSFLTFEIRCGPMTCSGQKSVNEVPRSLSWGNHESYPSLLDHSKSMA